MFVGVGSGVIISVVIICYSMFKIVVVVDVVVVWLVVGILLLVENILI